MSSTKTDSLLLSIDNRVKWERHSAATRDGYGMLYGSFAMGACKRPAEMGAPRRRLETARRRKVVRRGGRKGNWTTTMAALRQTTKTMAAATPTSMMLEEGLESEGRINREFAACSFFAMFRDPMKRMLSEFRYCHDPDVDFSDQTCHGRLGSAGMRKLGIVEWAEERGNVILEHFLPLRAIDWRPVLDIEEAKIAAMEVSTDVDAVGELLSFSRPVKSWNKRDVERRISPIEARRLREGPATEADFVEVARALIEGLAVVGITERFEESLEITTFALGGHVPKDLGRGDSDNNPGWALPSSIVSSHKNTGHAPLSRGGAAPWETEMEHVLASANAQTRIRKAIALDVRLYERAKEIFESQMVAFHRFRNLSAIQRSPVPRPLALPVYTGLGSLNKSPVYTGLGSTNKDSLISVVPGMLGTACIVVRGDTFRPFFDKTGNGQAGCVLDKESIRRQYFAMESMRKHVEGPLTRIGFHVKWGGAVYSCPANEGLFEELEGHHIEEVRRNGNTQVSTALIALRRAEAQVPDAVVFVITRLDQTFQHPIPVQRVNRESLHHTWNNIHRHTKRGWPEERVPDQVHVVGQPVVHRVINFLEEAAKKTPDYLHTFYSSLQSTPLWTEDFGRANVAMENAYHGKTQGYFNRPFVDCNKLDFHPACVMSPNSRDFERAQLNPFYRNDSSIFSRGKPIVVNGDGISQIRLAVW